MKITTPFTRVAVTALCAGFLSPLLADNSSPGKTFIDYFQPTPIIGTLSKDAWGAGKVGPP